MNSITIDLTQFSSFTTHLKHVNMKSNSLLEGLTDNTAIRPNQKLGNHHLLNILNGNFEFSIINWCYYPCIFSSYWVTINLKAYYFSKLHSIVYLN